jgi:hypothetical protein
MTEWTTRLEHPLSAVGDIHFAWFVPDGWPGQGPVVALLIPECELQVMVLGQDGEPVATVNRPQQNKNVKSWLRTTCEIAIEQNAALHLSCDTREQVESAVKRATKHLRGYRRMSLERLYQAEDRKDTPPQ